MHGCGVRKGRETMKGVRSSLLSPFVHIQNRTSRTRTRTQGPFHVHTTSLPLNSFCRSSAQPFGQQHPPISTREPNSAPHNRDPPTHQPQHFTSKQNTQQKSLSHHPLPQSKHHNRHAQQYKLPQGRTCVAVRCGALAEQGKREG